MRALFGVGHVIAFFFGLPLPWEIGAPSLEILLPFILLMWFLLAGVSLLLCVGPLVRQLDAFSLFRLRGWLVWGLFVLLTIGPMGVVIWLFSPSEVPYWGCGACLVTVLLHLVAAYGVWRHGGSDYKGGLMMQRGIFAPPQRELLERLVYRS